MRPRLVPLSALALGLALALAACCPVTAPPETAFVARLRPLGNGAAVAQLESGRQLTVTGLSAWPPGPVYVQGRLLPDGTVAVSSVRPTGAATSASTSEPVAAGAAPAP